jgi:hypothetical protein
MEREVAESLDLPVEDIETIDFEEVHCQHLDATVKETWRNPVDLSPATATDTAATPEGADCETTHALVYEPSAPAFPVPVPP